MNLAPCPDCGNDCSPLATLCPKCGRPFKPGDLKVPGSISETGTSTPAANVSPAAKKTANVGCLIAVVVLIILAIICMRGGPDSKADCEQERLRENQRRYAEAQRNPNYNPEYIGPCK